MSKYEFERVITDGPVKKDEKTIDIGVASSTPTIVLGSNTTTSTATISLDANGLLVPERMKDPYDSVCCSCGSDDIEEKYWVRTRDMMVMDCVDDGSDSVYCPDCGDTTEVIFRKDYKGDEEENEIEIGSKVMISERSGFYDDGCDDNPVAEVGTVINITDDEDDDLPIKVQWKNCTNVYSKEDLVKV